MGFLFGQGKVDGYLGQLIRRKITIAAGPSLVPCTISSRMSSGQGGEDVEDQAAAGGAVIWGADLLSFMCAM